MAREPAPLNWKTFILLLILALGLGSLYRFTDLGKKPMHTDEAILALKTHEYGKTHHFEYDPKDYHGPFLHHAASWVAAAKGWDTAQLTEEQVRWVVAVFGMALILLPLLFIDAIGRTGAVVAALLAAASPMLTYYSRYYIMEIPFVFLVGLFLGAVWRWSQKRNAFWLIVAGLCLGFMHATKETFVLNIAAMAAAWAFTSLQVGSLEPRNARLSYAGSRPTIPDWMAWTIVGVVAAITSVWMFSNGFKDWKGVQDSVATYESYLRRSGGSGHEKPWHYYIMLLSWRKDGFIWSEGLIMGLGLVGILDSFVDRRRPAHQRAFLTFLSVYLVILLGIYSVIPYKTPWSIMSFQYGFILLAGVGMRLIFRSTQVPFFKTILVILFGTGIYHLCSQTNIATDYAFPGMNRYAADPRNPYVYSHTSTNVLELSKRIHELAAIKQEGKETSIQVIQNEQGWPLPWYLRDLSNVGYQAEIPAKLTANIIVTDASNEAALKEKLEGEYDSSPYGLRPGLMLSLMVEKSLWTAYLNPDSLQAKPQPEEEPKPVVPAGPASLSITPPGGERPEGGVHLTPAKAEAPASLLPVPAGRSGSLPFTPTFAAPADPTMGDGPVRKAEAVPDDMPAEETPPKPKRSTRRNR